jgi:hypothetical protein
MEKLAQYSAILSQIIAQQATRGATDPNIEVVQIRDHETHQYQVLYLGWHGVRRIFTPVIHVRIHNDKIWIEHDGTEDGIALQLLAAGIPNEAIVLAFYSPQKRPYTDFAVA